MGVYVKEMEMPKSCEDCDTEFAYVICCDGWNGRPQENCPLVPVKTPHGRLIDADALTNTVYYTNISESVKEFIADLIEIAPTVIEAEEG